MIKKYLKSYLCLIALLIIFTIILTIFNYYLKKPVTIFKIIIPILSIFISSIILGKNSKELAYLEGIKYGTIYVIFITIIKILLKSSFNYQVIIIFFVLIISSIIGSMLGINIKK